MVRPGAAGLTAAAWGRFTDALLGLGPFGTQVPRGAADLVHQHGVPNAWLLLAPAVLALLVALGLQQAGFWLLAGTGEPSGEPGASGDETGAEPEPEPRADLHA